MAKYSKIWITVIVIFVGYIFYKFFYDGTVLVKSTLDGQYYSVRNSSDKQLRADLLANIKYKFSILITNLNSDSTLKNDTAVQRLINNWNSGISIKEIGNMENDAAYVINKKYMSFCLQKSNKVTLPEINLITYVAIHELAHVMSLEIGHGSEFIQNFEFLLNYAKKINYYDKLLNEEIPLFISLKELDTSNSYCGVKLTNSIS